MNFNICGNNGSTVAEKESMSHTADCYRKSFERIQKMRKAQKLAAGIAAAMVVSAMSAPVSFAADNAFGIDEINWTDQDWASIAMTNDDTVETGAVIRTKADADSDAAGYLYRGAAVNVVDKGEEWSEVRSGRVTGFVKNEYLAFGDDARGIAAHYGKQGIVANWNDVNVFSDSNADSEVAAQMKDGAAMSMLQDNGHWIAVQSGADRAGFVSEEDVTRVLLVDTAVPANGEDDADVPATMTAEDIPVQAAEAPVEEESYEAPSYAEAPTESYDENYSEPVSYAEDTSVYVPETSADVPTPASDQLSTQYVSDNAQIQELYDAYIAAQNAAMDCTSAEDAQAKADAAVAAWNAYLTACGETPVTTASTETTATGSETTGAQSTQTYTETAETQAPAVQTEAPAQTEAPVQTEAQTEAAQTTAGTGSSGSSAYGSYSDLDLLAAIIWCEAGNQPYEGMVAVGQVVMNRVASSSFPNSVSEVLNQPGQFTPASAGTLQAALASGVNSNCYAAAQDAMNGVAPVPGYPMYFNTHSGTYKLGAHYFS